MQKKKLIERSLLDELLENQVVANDIVIHEEDREEVSSSNKKQKANKRTKRSSEKDRAASETERERFKQLSDARKDHLKVYIRNFSNRATSKLVVKFHKDLIFSRNARTIFFILFAMKETNRQNKYKLLFL